MKNRNSDMYKRLIKYLTIIIICMTGFSVRSNAQFKEQAFSQTYNQTDSTAVADTSDQLFSFKELFRGLSHKEEIKIGDDIKTVVAALQILIYRYFHIVEFHFHAVQKGIVIGGTGAILSRA